MKEPFQCYVEFAPVSEEDEYRRQDSLIRLKSSGLATDKWAWGQMSNVDPIAMGRDQTKELIKRGPLVSQTLDQYAAGKIMAAVNKREQAEVLKNGEPMPMPATNLGEPAIPQGGPEPMAVNPRPMTTGVPNLAPMGSAEQMQQNLKKQRSQTPKSATQGRGVNAGGYK